MKVLFFALVLLQLVSCSSKPKSSSLDAKNDGVNQLLLNGSSDSGTAGGLMTVYFDFESEQLTADSKSVLEHNVQFLKNNKSVTVQVEGHCDERGGRQYNLALGERRAKTVKSYLQAKGIVPKRLQIVSYGKEKLIEHGSDEDSQGKNRRANFVITAK